MQMLMHCPGSLAPCQSAPRSVSEKNGSEPHGSESTVSESDDSKEILCRKIVKVEPCIALLAGEELGQLQEQDPTWGVVAKILRAGETLPNIEEIQDEHPDLKTILAQRDRLEVHEGVVYRQFYKEGRPMELQILLPKCLQVPLIKELHEK